MRLRILPRQIHATRSTVRWLGCQDSAASRRTFLSTGPQVRDDAFERRDDLVLVHIRFAELQLQIETLGRGSVLKHERLWPPGLRLGHCSPSLLAGHTPRAFPRQALDQRDHFLWCLLPNYLKKQ